MNQQEKVRLIVVGTAMFITGHIVGDLKAQYIMHRDSKKKKSLVTKNSDVFTVLTKWLNDASDTRTLNDVVEDWHYNHQFNKIVNEK